MAALFHITRLLLVILLRELNSSSAFPRGRTLYPESWQGLGENKQEGYGFGKRRPLQYIQALRQTNRKPNVYDVVHPKSFQNPDESPSGIPSFTQILNRPDPNLKTEALFQHWSDAASKWTGRGWETSPSPPQAQRIHPKSNPRSFDFNLKLPFASFPAQGKGTTLMKGSDSGSGLKGGTGQDSQVYRPTSVQIHSSFNSPSASEDSSEKGSTKNPNEGKNSEGLSKPSFQLSLSVPIPPPTPEPSSTNDYLGNKQPMGSDLAQNWYTEAVKPQSNLLQSGLKWPSLNSTSAVQQQTEYQPNKPSLTQPDDGKLVTFPPGHAGQFTTLSEQVIQPSLLAQQYASQSSDYHYEIDGSKKDPVKYYQHQQALSPDPSNVYQSQLQYETNPSGQYSSGQVKPSGYDYGQIQTWQTLGSQFNSPSEQQNYGQFEPPVGHGQTVATVPCQCPEHPSTLTVPEAQYEIQSFGYYNLDSNIANDAKKDNVGQTDYSYEYSRGQSGLGLPLINHPTALDPSSNFPAVSPEYQTQINLPPKYSGGAQQGGKPKYTKLLIHMEDLTDQGDGQKNPLAAQSENYDYSGKKTQEIPVGTSLTYMPVYSQTSMEMAQGQYASNPQKPTQAEQIQTSDSVPGQATYTPQAGANAGSVQANFGQQMGSEMTFLTKPQVLNPAKGQYPYHEMQPQYWSVENYYPVYHGRKQDLNAYSLGHYSNPIQS